MRKHGWQLPYHPLQVVAVAVFLALGFAFYVFFVPFVGRKQFQYVVMGIYTPLVSSVFCIYVWCASADPGDPGVFKSKKYLNIAHSGKLAGQVESGPSKSALPKNEDKPLPVNVDRSRENSSKELDKQNISHCVTYLLIVLFGWCPFSWIWIWPCSKEQPSDNESSEDGMFYCNLCEVEVRKYSKHCRVCDKCVDGFDHHCRWLNNCIGKRNYRRFFILMVSALLLLILQWSIGILVLVRCFLERKFFDVDIAAKLGSSFSLVPFVVVVVSCTLLAMVATLPLAQLFFFHVLLIRKGISTYDYIIALREQEQQGVPMHQTPQMTPLSSMTGLSSASSFNTFHRAAWCTPPRLFLEDQFDVIPPEKVMGMEEHSKKRTAGSVRINPWTLARLNAEEVSRAAAEARKKSKVLHPVVRREALPGQETDSSIFGSRRDRLVSRMENRRRSNKRINLPSNFALAQYPGGASDSNGSEVAAGTSSTSLAPLQLEARTAFHPARAMSTGILESSLDGSLESPDIHPFRTSSGTEEACELTTSLASENTATVVAAAASLQRIPLSRSTSDGYEASGGEDSDRVPSRIVHRSSDWSSLLFNSGHRDAAADVLRGSYSTAGHSDFGMTEGGMEWPVHSSGPIRG